MTAVRDPVSRIVSAFFQTAEQRSVDLDASADDLRTQLIELYWRSGRRDWWTTEFRTATGLDVYASEFSVEQGYAIYEGRRARALLVRTEDLSRVGPGALGEFLHCDPVPLVATNVGAAKAYGAGYAASSTGSSCPSRY